MVMNRIKVVLAELRRTCKWLATELGKSENTVSPWTTNRTQPSVHSCMTLQQFLILTLDVY